MARRRSRSSAAPTPQVGPQEGSPDAQAQYIDTEAQKHTSAIVISANDPKALCDSIENAQTAGTKVVTFDSDTSPDCRDLFVNQATADGIAKVEVDMIADQIGDAGEIAILSASANATNQNAWIDLMKKELAADHPKIKLVDDGLRQRRRPDLVRQDRSAAAEAPQPQGHHLADDGGHRRGGSLPVDLEQEGQGRADRAGHAEPDAQVRQGRHRQGVRAVEPGATSATWRRTPRTRWSKGDITGKEGDKFKAGKLGEFTVGADGTVLLGDPFKFNKGNIDKFNF